jgi:hypothetical protein
MDVYGDSLKYVNSLYNRHFSNEARKVSWNWVWVLDATCQLLWQCGDVLVFSCSSNAADNVLPFRCLPTWAT